ncbi:MAG TPA: glycosyl hydrolase family 18 protein [Methylomusa anaerophila]|uniref:Putative sporulation-specific glycosylase YdhD n=1 Tax=Methylomusa anaerophila TaxID=1930071 RepID=A0A348ALL6_9FIRM|nr:glycosyl hydrolase family 18 protein [Methylomusa anaerophila]BBB91964.1 putative sporulation-specific glycosylase YdhD [Methylomusa anaerophila]HML88024.1 glycosyl hydrolase family 18 protein [Methylomusa anaerophila]
MGNVKSVAFLLLLAMCTSFIIPVPAYASPSGDTGGFLGNLFGLLSNLLNSLFHINPTSPVSSTTPNQGPTGSKDVIGFYAEWWGSDTSSYNDLVKHTDSIGTIAPFWATLQEDGSVTDRGGNDHASVVKYAHDHKITALLLVNNAKNNNPEKGIHAILSNPSLRRTAIDNLEAYIEKYGLDGINVDFESVPAKDRDNLTAFMRELSARLKPQGYIVTIDVFPKHNEENDVAVAYDYPQLAQYADKIILMTYDYHGSWNGPGSIADIRSVEQDLKYALTTIPKNKLYLGIAGYGYDWSSKGVESLEYGAIQNLIDRFGVNPQWDDASKSPHFSYTGPDGIRHQVWYENSQSLKYRLDLVNKYDIAGIAIWKLGEEDPAYWQLIKASLKP